MITSPQIIFFKKFGMFIFFTILSALLTALIFLPAVFTTRLSPEGDYGSTKAILNGECCMKDEDIKKKYGVSVHATQGEPAPFDGNL